MTCRDFKDLMMGYLDNELSQNQKKTFEDHLVNCPECSSELKEFKKLKQITQDIGFIEPEDRLWQQYWGSIYNRLERNIGWIIFTIAAVLLIVYGGFKAIEELVKDPTVDLILKIALLVLIAGLAILFVSALRERLYFYKKDRYKDVRR